MTKRWTCLIALALLGAGCESAVPIDELPAEPPQTRQPAAVDPAPAGRAPVRPVTELALETRESWSALVKRGRRHLIDGDLREAEDAFTRAYDLSRGYGPSDPRTATSVRNLERVAAAYVADGDSASFGRVMELLVFVSAEVPAARSPELARLLVELAKTRRLQERDREAVDALLLARSILAEARGSEDASLVAIHCQLAMAHADLDDLASAETEIERAQEIVSAQESPSAELAAVPLVSRARLEVTRGDGEAARAAMRAALALHEEELGLEHPGTARVVRELALLEQETGDLASAEAHFDRVVSIWDALPNEHFQRAQSRNELAWFLVETNRPELAEAPARSALAMLEDQQIGGQPFAAAADTLATALRNQGRFGEAEGLYQEALEEGLKARGLPGWEIFPIADRYATLLEQTDRPAEAEEVRRRWTVQARVEPESEDP